MKKVMSFSEPLFITRPLLPEINQMSQMLKEIWQTRQLTNKGIMHKKLEERLINYLEVPYLSLFNNGTIALIVGCQALRLSGEVVTTPFTFPATVHVLSWNNVKPIFCDIEENTFGIDPQKIESLITPQTTAILAVHVFGIPCNISGIEDVAKKYGLKVVYDAAHAFGTKVDGKSIGNFGDLTMFSFHATKLFHTAEGGALTFRDSNLKSRVEFLKNFGIKNEEEVVMPGINGKMNEIQAAIGLLVIEMVEDELKKREKLFATYRQCLKDVDGIKLIDYPENVLPGFQYCVLRINEKEFGISRDELYSRLKKFNIFTRKYFYPLCSDYPCYKYLPSASKANLPVANQVVKETLSVPFYGELSEDDVFRICEIIKYVKDYQ